MAYEMTVALGVTDPETYGQYRAEIAPLLEAAGARFRYDFEVGRTLKNESDHEITRVFMLRFPDRESKERFFADPVYIEIRDRLFAKSVDGRTTLAESVR